jgi:hypothetical protein
MKAYERTIINPVGWLHGLWKSRCLVFVGILDREFRCWVWNVMYFITQFGKFVLIIGMNRNGHGGKMGGHPWV